MTDSTLETSRNVPCPRRAGARCRRSLLIVVALGAILVAILVLNVHPFLARQQRVSASSLVVEGWLPDYALQRAAEEFRQGGYQRLVTTGGPLDHGSYLAEFKTYAELARATLLRLGLPTNQVFAVPTERRERNRTFASAISFRTAALEQHWPLDAVQLVSLGSHARRSHLCFQRALGDQVRVGIIAIPCLDYPEDAWWKYSAGVKAVLAEVLGLAYAWSHLDYGT